MKLPERVTIADVGPRDGFQSEREFIPTENKLQIIEAIARAGVPRIEATSFMSPRAMPQTSDAEALMARLKRFPGTSYEGLIANIRGAQRAVDARVDVISVVISVTDLSNRANLNMTTRESLEQVPGILEIARKANIPVVAGMAASTGDPFSGQTPEERVLWVSDELAQMEVDELSFADSLGFGNPVQMERLAGLLLDRHPDIPLSVHIHDTRGMGLANAVACLQAGVTSFDASIGSLGGCPYAPGSTGNICTEDLVHMFHLMGVETGVDLDALIEASKLTQRLLGHELPGRVIKAGKSFTTYPVPEHLLQGTKVRQDLASQGFGTPAERR